MKYLKKFETVEEAYKAKHSIPFVGSVSGIERKAVFGSKSNIVNNGTVLKDKETGFVKTLPNVVVGKSIRPTSMPYLWYYCQNGDYPIYNQRWENGTIELYLNGEYLTKISPTNIYCLGLNNFQLKCKELVKLNKFDAQTGKMFLETTHFDGNAITTTEGVIIKDYTIVNIRPTILNDYHQFDWFNHITATRPYKRKYLARLNPSYKNEDGYICWERPKIRKFTKHGTCYKRCIMKVVNIAKKRWKSIHPIIFDKMYPLEIWEPNS